MGLLSRLFGERGCDHEWELVKEEKHRTMTDYAGSKQDLRSLAAREQALPGPLAPVQQGSGLGYALPASGYPRVPDRETYFYTMVERTWACSICGARKHTEEGPLDITTPEEIAREVDDG